MHTGKVTCENTRELFQKVTTYFRPTFSVSSFIQCLLDYRQPKEKYECVQFDIKLTRVHNSYTVVLSFCSPPTEAVFAVPVI